MSYPIDPNRLIRQAIDLNDLAQKLREEGWQVKLNATETGGRVWVEITQTNSCDPPAPEGGA